MDYTLDTDAAMKADSPSIIDKKGAYKGSIKMAKQITSAKGVAGVEISFESDSGQKANYLTMYTHYVATPDTKLPGYNALMALMTCVKLRGLNATTNTITEYDFESRADVQRPAEVYVDLLDARIGVVLRNEPYIGQDGNLKNSMKPVCFFNYQTDQVAKEILEKAEPEILERIIANLADKPLPDSFPQTAPPPLEPERMSAPPINSPMPSFDPQPAPLPATPAPDYFKSNASQITNEDMPF